MQIRYKKSLAVIAIVMSFIGVPMIAQAVTQTTTINASIASVISMTTSGTVSISVTPTSSGVMSSNSDAVAVSTNNSTGYTLTLADSDITTTLVNGSDSIAAAAGSQGTPSTTLPNNTWGYRVDGVGGFGTGPTTAETNVAPGAFKWAGVPATGSANTLASTSTTASADTTTVWYGVRADSTKPNGTYSDTVTYTATTN